MSPSQRTYPRGIILLALSQVFYPHPLYPLLICLLICDPVRALPLTANNSSSLSSFLSPPSSVMNTTNRRVSYSVWDVSIVSVEVMDPFNRSKRNAMQLVKNNGMDHTVALIDGTDRILKISSTTTQVTFPERRLSEIQDGNLFYIYQVVNLSDNSTDGIEDESSLCIIKHHKTRLLICMDARGFIVSEEASPDSFAFTQNCIWQFTVTSQGVMFSRTYQPTNVNYSVTHYLSSDRQFAKNTEPSDSDHWEPQHTWRIINRLDDYSDEREPPYSPHSTSPFRGSNASSIYLLHYIYFKSRIRERQKQECHSLQTTLLQLALKDAQAYMNIWEDFRLQLLLLEHKIRQKRSHQGNTTLLREWFFRLHVRELMMMCRHSRPGSQRGSELCRSVNVSRDADRDAERQSNRLTMDILNLLMPLAEFSHTEHRDNLRSPNVYNLLKFKFLLVMPPFQEFKTASVFAQVYLRDHALHNVTRRLLQRFLCHTPKVYKRWIRLKLENFVIWKEPKKYSFSKDTHLLVSRASTLISHLNRTPCLKEILTEETNFSLREDC